MKSINTVTLQGFLGKAPEFKKLDNNKSVANCSIAITETFKSGSEIKENTNWFRLVFWNNQAEQANELLSKGTPVNIKGKLNISSYKKDGVTINQPEIIVTSFVIIDKSAE